MGLTYGRPYMTSNFFLLSRDRDLLSGDRDLASRDSKSRLRLTKKNSMSYMVFRTYTLL